MSDTKTTTTWAHAVRSGLSVQVPRPGQSDDPASLSALLVTASTLLEVGDDLDVSDPAFLKANTDRFGACPFPSIVDDEDEQRRRWGAVYLKAGPLESDPQLVSELAVAAGEAEVARRQERTRELHRYGAAKLEQVIEQRVEAALRDRA